MEWKTDRRSFLFSTSALALGALPSSRLLGAKPEPVHPQAPDPLRNLIVVNGLGSLDEGYAPPPPGPEVLISAGAIKAGKASGLTAINMTLAGGEDFDATIAAIGQYDEFIRTHSADLTKIYSTADIRRAK